MSSVVVVGFGAISALGEGERAFSAGAAHARAVVAIGPDEELAAAGLARPFAARAKIAAGDGDRATVLLEHALSSCLRDLDLGWLGPRPRVGLALGTSSGGMRSAEKLFAAVREGRAYDAADGATYFAPVVDVTRRLGKSFAPAALVLGACASGAIAIGIGVRWLEADACDLVLAGGFDAVSVFVASGFEVLRATSRTGTPSPFRVGRDGMALGEGAAVLALARSAPPGSRVLGYVAGFGASADAVHLTAPERSGHGLARAASRALAEAEVSAVDLVSAHATATEFNDAAESRALSLALGERAKSVVVHPMKAQIGHTLGAAGALETLACFDAFSRKLFPAAAGQGAVDPDAAVHLLDVAEPGEPRSALKLASAFGGANAALVLTRDPPACRPRPRRDAYVTRAHEVAGEPSAKDLAEALGQPIDRIARADSLVRLALASVLALARASGPLEGAGIVVGHRLATLETNATYDERLRARGARMAEPRRFPYTSPNAVSGDCAVVFGLTGPGFATGLLGGLEALAIASELVRAGDADRMVVVAVDEHGPVSRAAFGAGEGSSGAVALLVSNEPAAWKIREIELGIGPPGEPGAAPSYRDLLPLADPSSRGAVRLQIRPGWGGFALVVLDPV